MNHHYNEVHSLLEICMFWDIANQGIDFSPENLYYIFSEWHVCHLWVAWVAGPKVVLRVSICYKRNDLNI